MMSGLPTCLFENKETEIPVAMHVIHYFMPVDGK
jgi:hypothetical protein